MLRHTIYHAHVDIDARAGRPLALTHWCRPDKMDGSDFGFGARVSAWVAHRVQHGAGGHGPRQQVVDVEQRAQWCAHRHHLETVGQWLSWRMETLGAKSHT